MPIEIRELVIKANLTEDGINKPEQKVVRQKDLTLFEKEMKRDTKDALHYQMQAMHQRILEECKMVIKEHMSEQRQRF